ncbi:MAG: hypothetical protein GXY06_02525 [Clostridiaceae bacterium]|nr:hypothetical protein [Clostridiaceae bacterium]
MSFRKWVADRYESFPGQPENINAQYNAAGLKIVPNENIEKYKIFYEEWNCIEMEADRKQRLFSDYSE